ncbi:hypothetical protein VTL71DRAFT_9393 [Oculimacula yallundae]|uniref:Uncharacterized protein n=1 Tax=Oculimacula yallundae TaxID=86028 RepID=A0ABR4BUG5_9HELO
MTGGFQKLRVPDNEDYYIPARTTEKVKVINHGKKAYDPGAPLASNASYEDYKRTNDRERRERDQKRKEREQRKWK